MPIRIFAGLGGEPKMQSAACKGLSTNNMHIRLASFGRTASQIRRPNAQLIHGQALICADGDFLRGDHVQ